MWLPSWIKAGVTQYNRNSIEFDNGSKIMATTTTENTGRGMSLTLIYCDEFAFVQPPEKAKEFWTSLSPTLSTGGKCMITSTPNSDEDQFALIWKEANKRFDEYGNDKLIGTNGFYAMKAHWSEHPDRNEEWAEAEKARIGDERFRREHECEFLIFDETLIDSIHLADMEASAPVETTGQVRWFKRPTPGMTYMVSLDPSEELAAAVAAAQDGRRVCAGIKDCGGAVMAGLHRAPLCACRAAFFRTVGPLLLQLAPAHPRIKFTQKY